MGGNAEVWDREWLWDKQQLWKQSSGVIWFWVEKRQLSSMTIEVKLTVDWQQEEIESLLVTAEKARHCLVSCWKKQLKVDFFPVFGLWFVPFSLLLQKSVGKKTFFFTGLWEFKNHFIAWVFLLGFVSMVQLNALYSFLVTCLLF